MHPLSDRDQVIERALRESARSVERDVHGGWRLTVANGALTRLRARIVDEDWLVVTTAYEISGESWWPLIQRNAGLDGSARLARAIGGDVDVRAEIFVGDDAEADRRADEGNTSIETRVAAMCDDVVSASHDAVDWRPDEDAEPMPRPWSDPDQLVKLCGEAGWSATARASGEVHVPLDTSGGAFQATLALGEAARLRAVVPLTASPVTPGAAQDAIALLLIEAGAHLRTVKGCAVPHAGGEVAGIAVAAERLPADAASVDRALAALSVACRAVGREVQALQDAHLARAYLELRRPHVVTRRTPQSRTYHTEDTPCLQLPS